MRPLAIAIVLLGLLSACAARPKPHQPQPEDSARAQIQHASIALLASLSDSSARRVNAYFAPRWTQISGPNRAAQYDGASAFDFINAQIGPLPAAFRLEQHIDDGFAVFAGAYDVEQATEQGLSWFANYRPHMGKNRMLALLPTTRFDSKAGAVQLYFIFVWEHRTSGWVVAALEIIRAGPFPDDVANGD